MCGRKPRRARKKKKKKKKKRRNRRSARGLGVLEGVDQGLVLKQVGAGLVEKVQDLVLGLGQLALLQGAVDRDRLLLALQLLPLRPHHHPEELVLQAALLHRKVDHPAGGGRVPEDEIMFVF